MRTGISLGVLFLILLFIEQSFLHAFFGGLASTPLMTIAGIIILQRVGIEEGAAWCIALALFHADIVPFILAILGPILVLQIFTTRSLYALIGFGIASYTVSAGVSLIIGAMLSVFFGIHILSAHPYTNALTEFFLLVPGLFLGILLVRGVERNILIRIAFRRST